MSSAEKPKLAVEQQVERLANKGVKFELISKEAAVEYLTKNNNYFNGKTDGLQAKLDVYLANDRLTTDEYNELAALLPTT